MDQFAEPPAHIELELDEVLLLVIALEDALDVFDRLVQRPPLQVTDLIGPMAGVETQLRLLHHRIGWTEGGHEPVEILRLAEAARRLGITTKDMVYLVHEGKIRYVTVDGIARIPSGTASDADHFCSQRPGFGFGGVDHLVADSDALMGSGTEVHVGLSEQRLGALRTQGQVGLPRGDEPIVGRPHIVEFGVETLAPIQRVRFDQAVAGGVEQRRRSDVDAQRFYVRHGVTTTETPESTERALL